MSSLHTKRDHHINMARKYSQARALEYRQAKRKTRTQQQRETVRPIEHETTPGGQNLVEHEADLDQRRTAVAQREIDVAQPAVDVDQHGIGLTERKEVHARDREEQTELQAFTCGICCPQRLGAPGQSYAQERCTYESSHLSASSSEAFATQPPGSPEGDHISELGWFIDDGAVVVTPHHSPQSSSSSSSECVFAGGAPQFGGTQAVTSTLHGCPHYDQFQPPGRQLPHTSQRRHSMISQSSSGGHGYESDDESSRSWEFVESATLEAEDLLQDEAMQGNFAGFDGMHIDDSDAYPAALFSSQARPQ